MAGGKWLCDTGSLPIALWQPGEVGWGAGGGFKREGIHVYLWLIHIIVQQKPTHCKEIILQLKVNLKNTYIYQIIMLYTLNILQLYLPILSQKILCLLVTIHDIWFIYVGVYKGKRKTLQYLLRKSKWRLFWCLNITYAKGLIIK